MPSNMNICGMPEGCLGLCFSFPTDSRPQVIAFVPSDIKDWHCNGYAQLFVFLPQGRIQIENGALSISTLNLSDSGMYQCVAENKHGVIYSSAQLMVLGKLGSFRVLLCCLSVCAFDHHLR